MQTCMRRPIFYIHPWSLTFPHDRARDQPDSWQGVCKLRVRGESVSRRKWVVERRHLHPLVSPLCLFFRPLRRQTNVNKDSSLGSLAAYGPLSICSSLGSGNLECYPAGTRVHEPGTIEQPLDTRSHDVTSIGTVQRTPTLGNAARRPPVQDPAHHPCCASPRGTQTGACTGQNRR